MIGFAWGSLSQSAADNGGVADPAWYSGFWQNFSTEMIGAVITFVFFTIVLGSQQERRQQEFFRDLTANNAQQQQQFLEELTRRTEEQNRKALQANAIARLRQAEKAEDTAQRQIILDEMKALDLLQGAYLMDAFLSGADLLVGNLDDVLWSHQYLEMATLPDGKIWTAETDLARFTDDKHPQYMTTFEQLNARRLDQGQELLGVGSPFDPEYPLPGERLDEKTMRERVNARRKELGMEAL